MRHACDNPSCCNAKHLLGGTQQDNIRDRDIRQRRIIKLTRANAEIICTRVNAGEFHHTVAADFDISRSVVTRIMNNQLWRKDQDENTDGLI